MSRIMGYTASALRRSGSADPYGDAVLASTPVAWWRGNGNVNDATGGTAGTMVGGSTFGAGFIPAELTAQSLSFDGVDDRVTIPFQSKFAPAATFSVELWFTAPATPANGVTIMSRPEWWLTFYSGKPAFGAYTSAGGFKEATSTGASVVAGTAYHMVGTYDGTNVRIYLNGTQGAATACTGTPNAGSAGINIGSWTTPSDFFNGRVAEAAFYNKALSASEIAAHYTAGTS